MHRPGTELAIGISLHRAAEISWNETTTGFLNWQCFIGETDSCRKLKHYLSKTHQTQPLLFAAVLNLGKLSFETVLG